METLEMTDAANIVARLSELPGEAVLAVWGELTTRVAEEVLTDPASLVPLTDGGASLDGRLDALMSHRRHLERAAALTQRVARSAEAVTHMLASEHHDSVRRHDVLSGEAMGEGASDDSRAYDVEAGEFAASALGGALGLTAPAARAMAAGASTLRARHPGLLAASARGDGSVRVAAMLAGELAHLEADAARSVAQMLIDSGDHRRAHQAARQACRKTLRRLGLTRPADEVEVESTRGVWFEPHLEFESLCTMTAVLDTYDATAIQAVMEERARRLQENSAPGARLFVGAARADALTDLILENYTVTATLNLQVPIIARPPDPSRSAVAGLLDPPRSTGVPDAEDVSDLLDARVPRPAIGVPPGHSPASPATSSMVLGACGVRGVGVLSAGVVARLAATAGVGFTATLASHHGCGRITTLATTTAAHRPSVGIAKLVRERDGVCRFPFCETAASRCDLDHVMPFDQGGPTSATNLQALCRHHHRAKTHGGFRVRMTPDGVCTWLSPSGARWVTEPGGITHADAVRAA